MDHPPTSRLEIWRARLQKFRAAIKRILPFASGILAAFAGLLLYNFFFPPPRPLTTQDMSTTVAQALASATPPPAFSELVYQEIRPSLVLIETTAPEVGGEPQRGLGSGVVVDDAGDILTSLHVIADATDILVTFADGTHSKAQVISRQPANDMAVIRADQPPAVLVPAVLGNPNVMQVGDEAYVVGNPFGLYSSMSTGVISGFGRSFQPTNSNLKLEGLIQIDAAVNPGNSGGPLLNRYGQVIGIVAGLVNPTKDNFFIGIGFAVPINVAVSGFGSPPY